LDKRVGLFFVAVSILLSAQANGVSADSRRIPETSKAIVLDPFNFEFGLLPYYDLFMRSIIYNLQQAGYAVDYYKDDNVTIDLLKRLDNEGYGVIYVNAHGFTDPDGRVLFFTGEKNASGIEGLYQKDIEEKRIGCFGQEGYLLGYYYVTPEFFALYGNDTRYHNALIFVDACHSANNTSMADVFLDLDASCYVGWTELVGVEHGVSMDGKFFRTMCIDGETVEQSAGTIRPDPVGSAKLAYFGDGGLVLVDAPLRPESEGVMVWVTIVGLAAAAFLTVGVLCKISRMVTRNIRKSRG